MPAPVTVVDFPGNQLVAAEQRGVIRGLDDQS
jgi:hypothetical protein